MDQVIHDLALWEGDLSHPATLKNEIRDWFKLWSDCEATGRETLPTNLLDALCQCDPDVSPCIHRLLTTGCTLPITSCEAERSFSVLRRTMNYIQSTMGRDRLTGLILMHMHRNIDIDPRKAVSRFIKDHSTRKFASSVLFD